MERERERSGLKNGTGRVGEVWQMRPAKQGGGVRADKKKERKKHKGRMCCDEEEINSKEEAEMKRGGEKDIKTQDKSCWGVVIHTGVLLRVCHRRFGGKHERVMTTWPHCECALSLLPSHEGKRFAVFPTALILDPRVHHTSRKRELLLLAWKGSDHIRRKSPFK